MTEHTQTTKRVTCNCETMGRPKCKEDHTVVMVPGHTRDLDAELKQAMDDVHAAVTAVHRTKACTALVRAGYGGTPVQVVETILKAVFPKEEEKLPF